MKLIPVTSGSPLPVCLGEKEFNVLDNSVNISLKIKNSLLCKQGAEAIDSNNGSVILSVSNSVGYIDYTWAKKNGSVWAELTALKNLTQISDLSVGRYRYKARIYTSETQGVLACTQEQEFDILGELPIENVVINSNSQCTFEAQIKVGSATAQGKSFITQWLKVGDPSIIYQLPFIVPTTATVGSTITQTIPANLLTNQNSYIVKVKSTDGCPDVVSSAALYTKNNVTRSYQLCVKWESEIGPATEPDPVFYLGGIDPAQAVSSLYTKAEACIKSGEDQIRQGLLICQNPDYVSDKVTVSFPMDAGHYMLYYYDRAGQLTKTIPPQGVEVLTGSDLALLRTSTPTHKMSTTYKYNSLGQLMQQNSPDGKTTYFVYDDLGRLKFSRDEEQKTPSSNSGYTVPYYSYTKYDELGRSYEVGVHTGTEITFDGTISINNATYLATNNFPSASNSQETKTFYSAPLPGVRYLDNAQKPQRNLLNRVSYAQAINLVEIPITMAPTNIDMKTVTTHYSYDVHGNVEWIAIDIPGMERKYVAYEYDLLSGKVHQVKYNEGKTDQFIHKYEYDEDSRIIAVYTSKDGISWDKDAKYEYYAHGPLKRIELGEQSIQGVDYIYTIQGWIKGINSPIASGSPNPLPYIPAAVAAAGDGNDINNDSPKPRYEQEDVSNILDAGKDGMPQNGLPSRFATDQFGMAIGYFNGDYKNATSAFDPSKGYTMPMERQLYNGNISTWSTHTNRREAIGNLYEYDILHRIKASKAKKWSSTEWGLIKNLQGQDIAKAFASAYSYDKNGNIQSMERYNHFGQEMDRLTYNYATSSNLLTSVTEATSITAYKRDFEGNRIYSYNKIGNITNINQQNAGDMGGTTNIKWTSYNKPSTVTKVNSAGVTSTILYLYDAMGNRVAKHISGSAGTTLTYHARDAQGNVLSTYEQKTVPDNRIRDFEPIEESNIHFCHAYIGNKGLIFWVDKLGRVYKVTNQNYQNVPIPENYSYVISYNSNTSYLISLLGETFFSMEKVECYNQFCQLYKGGDYEVEVDCNGKIVSVLKGGDDITNSYMFSLVSNNTLHIMENPENFNSGTKIDIKCMKTTKCYANTACILYDADGTYMVWVSYGKIIKVTTTGEPTTDILNNTEYTFGFAEYGGKPFLLVYNAEQVISEILGMSCITEKLCSYYTDGNNVYWIGDYGEVTKAMEKTGNALDGKFFLVFSPSAGLSIISDKNGYSSFAPVECVGKPIFGTSTPSSLRQTEVPIYGSDRVGMYTPRQNIDDEASNGMFYRPRGGKRYELKDHLGNVRVTVSDRKHTVVNGNSLELYAEILHYTDYYPFGMSMPSRSYSDSGKSAHRYGFNGKENDQDMGEGIQDYGFRIYDELVCRFLDSKMPAKKSVEETIKLFRQGIQKGIDWFALNFKFDKK
jgi:YD repeat-containing protein